MVEWVFLWTQPPLTEPSCGACQLTTKPCKAIANLSVLKTIELNTFFVLSECSKGAVGHIVHTEKGVLAVEKNKVLIPPLWNKTFCWGFDDFTCCFGNYGSEKVKIRKNISVSEMDVM